MPSFASSQRGLISLQIRKSLTARPSHTQGLAFAIRFITPLLLQRSVSEQLFREALQTVWSLMRVIHDGAVAATQAH